MHAAAPPPDVLEKFPQARQIAVVHTTSEKRRPEAKERKTETHYYVVTGPPSMRRLSASRLAAIIRHHWGIENRLHHRLDRTLREDDQKTRSKNGAAILSWLRKISLLATDTVGAKSANKRYLPELHAMLSAKPKKALGLVLNPLSL